MRARRGGSSCVTSPASSARTCSAPRAPRASPTRRARSGRGRYSWVPAPRCSSTRRTASRAEALLSEDRVNNGQRKGALHRLRARHLAALPGRARLSLGAGDDHAGRYRHGDHAGRHAERDQRHRREGHRHRCPTGAAAPRSTSSRTWSTPTSAAPPSRPSTGCSRGSGCTVATSCCRPSRGHTRSMARRTAGAGGGRLRPGLLPRRAVLQRVPRARRLLGREAEATIGLRNRWQLAPGVRLDASFERVSPIRGGDGARRRR